MMRSKIIPLLLAASVAACSAGRPDHPQTGIAPVNVPVVQRADFVFDAAAPGGTLAPGEAQRLDGWFQGLGLGYGDTIYVDGGYSPAARGQVAAIAGNYGLMVVPGVPVTGGAQAPGSVRVVVSRNRAVVPNCPNWSDPSQPNYTNRTMSNFGCAVNSNLAAMVANPEDLVHGREDGATSDGLAGAKAIRMYREWPLTGIIDGQQKRPLKQADTKKDDK